MLTQLYCFIARGLFKRSSAPSPTKDHYDPYAENTAGVLYCVSYRECYRGAIHTRDLTVKGIVINPGTHRFQSWEKKLQHHTVNSKTMIPRGRKYCQHLAKQKKEKLAVNREKVGETISQKRRIKSIAANTKNSTKVGETNISRPPHLKY